MTHSSPPLTAAVAAFYPMENPFILRDQKEMYPSFANR